MRIVVIGSGNVAQALCKVISESSMSMVQVFARNGAHAEEIANRYRCAFTYRPEELAQADLYILAVTEDCITTLSGQLDFGDAVVAHTSGTASMEKIHSGIVNRGVIYPLQTFTKWRDVDMYNTPILIEGNTPLALARIREFGDYISGCVKEYTFEQRLRADLAAVFASNFSNHMYIISEQILAKAGLSFDLMKPLILESAHKTVEQNSPQPQETDRTVINNCLTRIVHWDILHYNLKYQSVYVNLSNYILELLKKP